MSTTELIDGLRRAGSTWFRNFDLLMLEELIRRFRVYEEVIMKEQKND